MDTESRLEGAPLGLQRAALALRADPTAFAFMQAVRLLERMQPDRAPVGGFGDPAAETARFAANPAIGFPASEIQALAEPDGDAPVRLTVNFFGVTGPSGMLPHEYTLLVADRLRERDSAAAAFFDMFNHRAVSLLYRAWRRARFAIAHEAGEADLLARHVLDLAGVGLDAHRRAAPVPEALLVDFGGLLAAQPRSAAALEQLIEAHFAVPTRVEPLVGGWFVLPRRDQCMLDDDASPANRLGRGAVVGDEIRDEHARARIRIGPLDRHRFDAFLPGGEAYDVLRRLVRFFSHDQIEFELQLVLAEPEVPACVLGDEDDTQRLGWSTWVRTRELGRDADETILQLDGRPTVLTGGAASPQTDEG